jgi:hypothetical protein
MMSRMGLVSASPVVTTIATTTPWLLAAFSGVLWRRDRSDFSLDAPYHYQQRSSRGNVDMQ